MRVNQNNVTINNITIKNGRYKYGTGTSNTGGTVVWSGADGKLIPAAKEQARIVLEEFYKQWIKAYDASYTVEVK